MWIKFFFNKIKLNRKELNWKRSIELPVREQLRMIYCSGPSASRSRTTQLFSAPREKYSGPMTAKTLNNCILDKGIIIYLKISKTFRMFLCTFLFNQYIWKDLNKNYYNIKKTIMIIPVEARANNCNWN